MVWKKKYYKNMSKNIKKIIGQPLLTVSYKKPLEKIFALGFANGSL
jgi:hypothetical protein